MCAREGASVYIIWLQSNEAKMGGGVVWVEGEENREKQSNPSYESYSSNTLLQYIYLLAPNKYHISVQQDLAFPFIDATKKFF